MSRIGKKPIAVPAGVEVKIDGHTVTVKGPKGTLSRKLNPAIDVKVEDGQVNVIRPNDEKESRSLHGLCRTLVNNMVVGVTQGFEKKLEAVPRVFPSGYHYPSGRDYSFHTVFRYHCRIWR